MIKYYCDICNNLIAEQVEYTTYYPNMRLITSDQICLCDDCLDVINKSSNKDLISEYRERQKKLNTWYLDQIKEYVVKLKENKGEGA